MIYFALCVFFLDILCSRVEICVSVTGDNFSNKRLLNKFLEQGYVKERLKSSLRKFYGRYGDLIKQYEVSLSQMLNDIP